MKRIGRPSKVRTLDYADEISELRSEGYSYEKIANIMNNRYPKNPTISKDVVHRHLTGLTKKTLKPEIVTIQQLIGDTFQDFYYKLKTASIDGKERNAIISYMRAKEKMLKSRTYEYYASHDKPYSEYQKVREFILDFTHSLCVSCRRKVVQEVLEMESNNGE
jgi:hypothetical protein